MSGSRILVTGAAGFLGLHIIRQLRAEGHQVVAHGRTVQSLARFVAEDIPVVSCDLQIPKECEVLSTLGTLHGVVHAAGLSSNWGPRSAFEAANVEATRRLLSLVTACGKPHFIHVSSSSVYFDFQDRLQVREDQSLPQPVNDYAWSKRAAEELVRQTRDLPTTIVRPRGIYGRGDVALLPRLLRAAARGPLPLFRSGQTIIDLTHVEDVVGAIIAILRSPDKTAGKTYNVSGGEPIAVREIIEQSAARADVRINWRPVSWPMARTAIRGLELFHKTFKPSVEPFVTAYSAGLLAFNQTLDISSIERATGWRPRIRFAEGLERTFGVANKTHLAE